MRPIALALLLPALIALDSCTRVFRVEAVMAGGALTFVSKDDEARSPPWCWSEFRVFDDSGREMWAFDAYEAYRGSEPCGPNFPLTYGRAPAGARVTKGAETLQPGPLYVISGHAAGLLEGAFTLSGSGGSLSVRNLDPGSADVRNAESDFWNARGEAGAGTG